MGEPEHSAENEARVHALEDARVLVEQLRLAEIRGRAIAEEQAFRLKRLTIVVQLAAGLITLMMGAWALLFQGYTSSSILIVTGAALLLASRISPITSLADKTSLLEDDREFHGRREK